LWDIQQACFLLYIAWKSFKAIDSIALPSRHTIGRWIKKFQEDFICQALHLKSSFSKLGTFSDFERFWKNCLTSLSLAKSMLILNLAGVNIP